MARRTREETSLDAESLTAGLTAAQCEAVTHDAGPLLVVAGAGTGKTSVLTRRIAWLIATKRARPEEILALTFTDKAAAELKERIVTRCREQLRNVFGLAEMYIGTIHGFCLELLMTEVPHYLKSHGPDPLSFAQREDRRPR